MPRRRVPEDLALRRRSASFCDFAAGSGRFKLGGEASLPLPAGLRAVAIKGGWDKNSKIFANVLPGSRVDVIHVARAKDDQSTVARVLMEGVLVLAVDTKAESAPEVWTTTLAVSPADAERLGLAEKTGTLVLSLRGPR